MGRKFFGTDGIRGRTNQAPMTAEMAQRVGQAAGAHFLRGDHRHRVVIGKDTRLSGYMMETAMISGFTSVGMDVVMVGPVPTPAVALLTRSMRADLGVMISASHNPYVDNGIKLFGPDGYKLSDEDEAAIEALLEAEPVLVDAPLIGRARRIEDARGRYIHAAKSTFPEELRLDGLKIVVDCANGAAYQVAPSALWELGAEVVDDRMSRQRHQHQRTAAARPRRRRFRRGVEEGPYRHRARRRRRPADHRRREGDRRRRPSMAVTMPLRGRRLPAGKRPSSRRHVEPRLERFSIAGLELYPNQGGDRYVLEAMRESRLQRRRRAIRHIILSDYATPATASSPRSRSSPALERGRPAAESSTSSIPCPSSSRTSASAAARRWRQPASNPPSPPPKRASRAPAASSSASPAPSRSSESWPRARTSGWSRKWSIRSAKR
jgi:phosphoglucosamine mutase